MVALRVQPNDRFAFTPRLIYQDVAMDGWNRIDAYNILANPFTTSRPAVTLGEREQFTQIDEPYTDTFLLGDVTLEYDVGGAVLTSITSLTDRDVEVVRGRVGAWRQHLLQPVRRAARGLRARLSPGGCHYREGTDAGDPRRGRRRTDGLGTRLVLQHVRAPVRAERVRRALRGGERRRGHRLPASRDGRPRISSGRDRVRWPAIPTRKSCSTPISTITSISSRCSARCPWPSPTGSA